VIPELLGNDWKLFLKRNVRTGLHQAARLSSDPTRGALACDCDRDGLSTSGAHVLQACDRKFLAFREQVFVTRRESHDQSGQPVLVERRLDFINKLPTASHTGSMPIRLIAVMGQTTYNQIRKLEG
jgi:hypothetical protein